MRIPKGIISLFLLFTYLLGSAHELIPHGHAVERNFPVIHDEAGPDRSGDLEQTGSLTGSNAYSHFFHRDHLDESVLEYVICIMGQMEHPASEKGHCHYVPSRPDNRFSPVRAASVTLPLISSLPDEAGALYARPMDVRIYWSPLLSGPSHRGPPADLPC